MDGACKPNLEARLAVVESKIDLIAAANERALMLAQKEVNRRLDILNGEAERLRLMQQSYLPREVAETRLTIVEKTVARQGIIAAVAAAVVAAAFIVKALIG